MWHTHADGEQSEGEGEEEEGEDRVKRVRRATGGRGRGRCERGVRQVKWSVPDGFKVAAEPETLDTNLIGSTIYMRWETYGWQLGKITDVITAATPRLYKKFNFRLVWADKSKGPGSLRLFVCKTMLSVQTHVSTPG